METQLQKELSELIKLRDGREKRKRTAVDSLKLDFTIETLRAYVAVEKAAFEFVNN
jgi:hypothetical protein